MKSPGVSNVKRKNLKPSVFVRLQYLGLVEVDESRGMHVCEEAVKKLKVVSNPHTLLTHTFCCITKSTFCCRKPVTNMHPEDFRNFAETHYRLGGAKPVRQCIDWRNAQMHARSILVLLVVFYFFTPLIGLSGGSYSICIWCHHRKASRKWNWGVRMLV